MPGRVSWPSGTVDAVLGGRDPAHHLLRGGRTLGTPKVGHERVDVAARLRACGCQTSLAGFVRAIALATQGATRRESEGRDGPDAQEDDSLLDPRDRETAKILTAGHQQEQDTRRTESQPLCHPASDPSHFRSHSCLGGVHESQLPRGASAGKDCCERHQGLEQLSRPDRRTQDEIGPDDDPAGDRAAQSCSKKTPHSLRIGADEPEPAGLEHRSPSPSRPAHWSAEAAVPLNPCARAAGSCGRSRRPGPRPSRRRACRAAGPSPR